MDVRPKPLSQGDVDSADSDVDDGNDDNGDNDRSEVNETIAEETMLSQAPEASGEGEDLGPSIGLLDPEGYVDMREPWIEGAKGEKVRLGGMSLGKFTDCL
jgi:hypothetical protein